MYLSKRFGPFILTHTHTEQNKYPVNLDAWYCISIVWYRQFNIIDIFWNYFAKISIFRECVLRLCYLYDLTTLLLFDLQIPSDGFQAVSRIQVLDLSGNASSLPEHPAFSSMSHLQELYLRSVSWKFQYNHTHWCTCTRFYAWVCLFASMFELIVIFSYV